MIQIFAGVLAIFVLASYIVYFFMTDKYNYNVRKWRKGLYTLFVLGLMVALFFEIVGIEDWKDLLILGSFVFLADLGVLLTPSVSKFLNTEFEYESYVEEVIKNNNQIRNGNMQRANYMSTMIQNIDDYFHGFVLTNDQEQLEEYLRVYTEHFGLKVSLFLINFGSSSSLADDIKLSLDTIELNYLLDLGNKKDSFKKTLAKSEIVSIEQHGIMIVPILTQGYAMLAVLRSGRGEVLEIDSTHIVNLTYLYYNFT
ncbi:MULTISPECIES: type II toxin-antitoxin system SpoIISA family toxin [unclassified Psychrobacillus]|uniref:type II toxin-antitoxin system SpoIISA family toxin n=1 Tax=unclassified Psychrobacillus TaxID=2636677 RepID=UPI0030FBD95D